VNSLKNVGKNYTVVIMEKKGWNEGLFGMKIPLPESRVA
jgi:hypothetical protein